jgi:hypothetical protein
VIGSVLWRIKNYGLWAALKYSLSLHSRRKSLVSLPELDLEGLIKILGLPSEESIKANFRITQIMSELRGVQNNLGGGPSGMKPVAMEGASIARLVVLDLVISKIEPDLIIETGTQHGVSASVISDYVSRSNKKVLAKTIDVAHQLLIRRESNVNYIVLETPIRRSFKKETIAVRTKNTVFFHDSDHSYENMYFEFNWAWNRLGVSALVSDDADGNSAFLDFCSRNNLPGFLISIDSGPSVGLILRN